MIYQVSTTLSQSAYKYIDRILHTLGNKGLSHSHIGQQTGRDFLVKHVLLECSK